MKKKVEEALEAQKPGEYELRKKSAEVKSEKPHEIAWLYKIYDQPSHFIYELIQNAHDAGAGNIRFYLSKEGLLVIHDGSRSFREEDVYFITEIGDESSKSDETTKIGRFGVGFKAIYAYTRSPLVVDANYQFRIENVVLPVDLDQDEVPEVLNEKREEKETAFYLPFDLNDPDGKGELKKEAQECFDEIRVGLMDIEPLTLLYLKDLRSIEIMIEGLDPQRISKKGSAGKVGICYGDDTDHYFLHWGDTSPVGGKSLPKCAIAFPMDLEGKICKANTSEVAAYFYAHSEQSRLNFHLHAPFQTNLSRDSIPDNEVNRCLIEDLGKCFAKSLSALKVNRLLTTDTLSTIFESTGFGKYEGFLGDGRTQLGREPLIPALDGSYRKIKHCRTWVKDTRVEKREAWLEIFGVETLVRFFGKKKIRWVEPIPSVLGAESFFNERHFVFATDRTRTTFLEASSVEELNKIYQFFSESHLGNIVDPTDRRSTKKINEVPFIKSEQGEFLPAKDIYFRSGYTLDCQYIHSDLEAAEMVQVLKKLGVRSVDENMQILKKAENYDPGKKSDDELVTDLADFVRSWDAGNDVHQTKLISHLKSKAFLKNEDGRFESPSRIYVEDRENPRGVGVYYDKLDENATASRLATFYVAIFYDELERNEPGFFSELGIQRNIPPPKKEQKIPLGHPDYAKTRELLEKKKSQTGGGGRLDSDFSILTALSKIPELSKDEKIQLARGILELLDCSGQVCFAQYKFKGEELEPFPSSFAYQLRGLEWIPQEKNGEVSFSRPEDAQETYNPLRTDFDKLTKGTRDFLSLYSSSDQTALQEMAEESGHVVVRKEINDHPVVQEAMKKAEAEMNRRDGSWLGPELKTDGPRLEEGITQRKKEKLRDTSGGVPVREKTTKKRSVDGSESSEDAQKRSAYLKNEYKDDDGMYWCQICGIDHLPFEKESGETYVEVAEIFPESLDRSNGLCLCAEHHAMFKHAKRSKPDWKEELNRNYRDDEDHVVVEIEMCEELHRIHFKENHAEALFVFLEQRGNGQA